MSKNPSNSDMMANKTKFILIKRCDNIVNAKENKTLIKFSVLIFYFFSWNFRILLHALSPFLKGATKTNLFIQAVPGKNIIADFYESNINGYEKNKLKQEEYLYKKFYNYNSQLFILSYKNPASGPFS